MRTVSIFVLSLFLINCNSVPKLDVDPCMVEAGFKTCYAIPLDSTKPEYERNINIGDTALTPDEVVKTKKYINAILSECGEKCSKFIR